MARVTVDERAIRAAVAAQVTQLTSEVLEEAIRTCPRRSGRLARSLRDSITVRGRNVVGEVFSDLEYADYVHDGRGPVRARKGGALGPLPSPYPRFVTRVGPAAANPWLFEAARRVIGSRVQRTGD